MIARVASLLIVFLCSVPISAAESVSEAHQQARETIDQVLATEEFSGKKIVTRWRFIDAEDIEKDEKIPDWMISLMRVAEKISDWLSFLPAMIETILWAALALAIIATLYYFRASLADLMRLPATPGRSTAAPAKLFGLDVRQESLPDDVIAEVTKLWADGASRAAIALLYRATIARLIHQHAFAFHAGHTEGECVLIVKAGSHRELADFFSRLTHSWKQLAYGHRLPLPEQVHALCEEWRTTFDATTVDTTTVDT